MSKINEYKPCCLKKEIFKKGSKIDIICRFIFYYMIIVGIAIVFYTRLVPYNKYVLSDVINLFVWGTYIMAPIVLIWTYDSWKEQHNKTISSEMLKDTIINLIRIKAELYCQIDWLPYYLEESYQTQNKNIHILSKREIRVCEILDKLKYHFDIVEIIVSTETYEIKYKQQITDLLKKTNDFIDIFDVIEMRQKNVKDEKNTGYTKEKYEKFCQDLINKHDWNDILITHLENIINELRSEMEAK